MKDFGIFYNANKSSRRDYEPNDVKVFSPKNNEVLVYDGCADQVNELAEWYVDLSNSENGNWQYSIESIDANYVYISREYKE